MAVAVITVDIMAAAITVVATMAVADTTGVEAITAADTTAVAATMVVAIIVDTTASIKLQSVI